jgi:hypothetical protein
MLNAAISGGTTLEKQAAIAAIGASESAAADAAFLQGLEQLRMDTPK